MTGTTYHLNKNEIHYKWDNSLKPAMQAEAGDIVVFELQDVSAGQVAPSSTKEDLLKVDFEKIYPLGGPIFVNGAKAGDILEVEVLDLRPMGWGWTGIFPGLGLLPEDFPRPYLKHWDLSNGKTTRAGPGIIVPLDPFCGVMGVAPAEKGVFHPLPPGDFGGNIDIRHLTKGSTIFLPVQVEGAMFSCGDCHAAQGDGEVCVTGIEAPMWVTLKFNIRKGFSIPQPHFLTPGPLTRKYDGAGYYATTGISPDLMDASRKAVRQMITHLVRTYGLGAEEAYVLASVSVDLKINEVVDRPNWIVSAYLPLSIFDM